MPFNAPVLHYAQPGKASGIDCVEDESGVSISIRPRPLWSIGLVISGPVCFMALLTGALAKQFLLTLNEPVSAEMIIWGVGLVLFWIVIVLVLIEIWHRRRVPTIISVNQGKLILVTPDRAGGFHREFPAGDAEVRAAVEGVSVLLRKMGRLEVKLEKSAKIVVFHGDLRDADWMARKISGELKKQAKRTGTLL